MTVALKNRTHRSVQKNELSFSIKKHESSFSRTRDVQYNHVRMIMMIIDEDGNNNCGRLRCWRYGIVVVLIFVYHCGVVLILLVDKSIVVLFWYYWLTRAWVQRWRSCGVIVVSRCTQAQRYQNGSKFWDKGGKSGQPTPVHPLVHSGIPLCTLLQYTLVQTLVHSCAHSCTPWHTLVHALNTFVHPCLV